MRWLRLAKGKERGAAGVMVAILVPVLIGMGAVAVDVGNIFSTRAQLQNGADASALAIAQTCVTDQKAGTTCTLAEAQPLGARYAAANSQDGKNVVSSINLDTTAGRVTVQTKTPAGGLSLTLAQAIGQKSMDVTASATATWGAPLTGPAVLPMVFAPCQITPDSGIVQYLYSKAPPAQYATCAGDWTTGHAPSISGGFQWAVTNGTCSATVNPGPPNPAWIYSDPGASAPSGCTNADFANQLGKVVLFPVYSGTVGNGSNGQYVVQEWVAFRLMAYRLGGQFNGQVSPYSVPGNSNSRGIAGYFVSYVADPSTWGMGGSTQGGVQLYGLTQ